ncbi:MAG TPA: hypothetical protein VGD01_15800 [Candidatus Elarobacter sp.]|jgi:hypothetical protein
MHRRHSAALIGLAMVAIPLAASAHRHIAATWSNPPDAPFTMYNCRGEDGFNTPFLLSINGYYTNVSGKDITELGVHFRLVRADGSQIIGFTVAAAKRVTSGTKNDVQFGRRVPFTGIDHIECAPSFAKFADGTAWKAERFNDRPEDPRTSAPPSSPS